MGGPTSVMLADPAPAGAALPRARGAVGACFSTPTGTSGSDVPVSLLPPILPINSYSHQTIPFLMM